MHTLFRDHGVAPRPELSDHALALAAAPSAAFHKRLSARRTLYQGWAISPPGTKARRAEAGGRPRELPWRPAFPPTPPAPEHAHEKPRQPQPDRERHEGERVQGRRGSQPPGGQVRDGRLDDHGGGERAERGRGPPRPAVAPAHLARIAGAPPRRGPDRAGIFGRLGRRCLRHRSQLTERQVPRTLPRRPEACIGD
jgi:hypothetical protein